MAGKIPNSFIDELVGRVDIVDVIDRRVPLTRKGKEFQACCPFHDEKTPSFTVSPNKQFYHCFGCGAHGTAIGFLMDYANLGFVEAIEELADGVGLQVPKETAGGVQKPAESTVNLVRVVEKASEWFQQQLRNHVDAKLAIDYLKSRGLDGKTIADFGIGFAPESWDNMVNALGTTPLLQEQLIKTGLISKKDTGAGQNGSRFYDRFRNRVIFPIEDHRGQTVAFGGRILGDGEPKYLNSPETPLFHKSAELYGLHRARREIGAANKSIVVEGYMDVVSLAQFEINNCVATLGTATTRIHLQRLFRLAPEIIFCFDGDRAGRDAAWKGLQVSLSEIQDGRQIGFLFLPDGEDPDTMVRSEGKAAFVKRVDEATPLPEFLFENLISQVDMSRRDGKARLVSLAKPLISQLPEGALRNMMFSQLSTLSGLTENQLASATVADRQQMRQTNRQQKPPPAGQISPLAFATSLLLQNPDLALDIEEDSYIHGLKIQGSDAITMMIKRIQAQPQINTAQLLESFRESPYHSYLEKLAMRANFIDEDVLKQQFMDTLLRLVETQDDQRRMDLLEKSRSQTLLADEKAELLELLGARTTIFSDS